MRDVAVAVAHKLGIPCTQPVVISNGMNTVVHLQPSPIVARVSRIAHMIRPVDVWVEGLAFGHAFREYVVPPSLEFDPGPHVESGRFVTLWEYVEEAKSTPEETGSSLRALHQAASAYPGSLRSFDPRSDARIVADLIGGKIGAVLRGAAAQIEVPELAQQPIHGDANFSNVIAGGRWLDLDDVCIGPPEWDLACLRHVNTFFGERGSETYRALAAYGSHDESAVAALAPLVVLAVTAWGALAPLVGVGIGPRTQQRIDWLAEHYSLSQS